MFKAINIQIFYYKKKIIKIILINKFKIKNKILQYNQLFNICIKIKLKYNIFKKRLHNKYFLK